MDTSPCQACPKKPINYQPGTIVHTGELNHVCQATTTLTFSAFCWIQQRADRLILESDRRRQTGWWKTQSRLARWVSDDDERGVTERHMSHISAIAFPVLSSSFIIVPGRVYVPHLFHFLLICSPLTFLTVSTVFFSQIRMAYLCICSFLSLKKDIFWIALP